MLTLILTVAIHAAPAAQPVAQVQTCQWPHTCVSAPVAQVQTCQWPHTCVETQQQAPLFVTPVAQVQTCQWPHTCAKKA